MNNTSQHILKKPALRCLYLLLSIFERGISLFLPQYKEIPFDIFNVCIICNMSKRNTVGLRQEVYSRLKNKGRFGESFSELISRLLDESEEIPNLNDGGKKFN